MSHRVARPYLAVPAAALITITCRMYYIQLVPLPIFHRVTVLAYTGSFLFGSFGCTHQNPATTPHPTTTRGRAVLSTIRVTFLRLLKARKAGGRGHEASLPVFFCCLFFLHQCKSIVIDREMLGIYICSLKNGPSLIRGDQFALLIHSIPFPSKWSLFNYSLPPFVFFPPRP